MYIHSTGIEVFDYEAIAAYLNHYSLLHRHMSNHPMDKAGFDYEAIATHAYDYSQQH
jgi:hypothetical protein